LNTQFTVYPFRAHLTPMNIENYGVILIIL